MINNIITVFSNLPKELIVFLLSMAPLSELRGGIAAAFLYDFPLYKTLVITIIANMIPIPFILLFIQNILKFLRDRNIFTKLIDKVTNRAMSKSHKVENLEFWGLVLFVAIPLPTTGAWTGALIASLLNIDFKKAILAIFIGVVCAALIMSFVTYGLVDFIF